MNRLKTIYSEGYLKGYLLEAVDADRPEFNELCGAISLAMAMAQLWDGASVVLMEDGKVIAIPTTASKVGTVLWEFPTPERLAKAIIMS